MSLTAPPRRTGPASEAGPPPRGNPRARARRRLLLLGLLPAVLAVAFFVEVRATTGHAADGRIEWRDGSYSNALDEFAANEGTPNLFEQWIAPFDEGTAAFGGGSFDDAVELFELALDRVPTAEECLVRINLALTHEQIGDAAAEGGEPEAAAESWQTGIDVLTEGGCSDDAGSDERTQDSTTTEERLRAKLEQQEQQQQREEQEQQGGGRGGDQGQQGEEPQDPRERELERRNQQGEQEREENEDRQDYLGYNDDYEW